MAMSQLIKYQGYPVEEYSVTTQDGYILGLQRIPHGHKETKYTDRPVALLQHCLLCSSVDWVMNPRQESLGFILADAGFDVWLGNSRGNYYSMGHVNLSVESVAFWNFSWDEMAMYDLPASVKFVLKTSGQKQLFYVGHSQGTLIAFAEFSRNAELAKKVKIFFALAPVANLQHTTSPLRYLAHFTKMDKFIFDELGVKKFLPSNWIVHLLADLACSYGIPQDLCESLIFEICGTDIAQMNKTRLPIYLAHTPAGTSVKNIIHYAQMYLGKHFQMYDYGTTGNIKTYKQSKPPVYDVSQIRIPTAFFSGGHDWIADPIDVNILIKKYKQEYVIYNKKVPTWQHLDFIWGINAHTMIYQDIVDIMTKSTGLFA